MDEKILLEKFRAAKFRLAEVREEEKIASADFEAVKLELITYLKEREMKGTGKYEGLGFATLEKPEIKANVLAEDREKLFEYLKEQGLGDVIKPTVHHSTLSAIVADQYNQGKPVPDFIKVFWMDNVRFYERT